MISRRLLSLASVLALALGLGGCGFFQGLEAEFSGSASATQVQLVANWENNTCNLVTLLGGTAIAIDTIVQPRAGVGGAGASTQNTILKAQAIGQLGCQVLNGVQATLTQGNGKAVASVPAAVPTVTPGQ